MRLLHTRELVFREFFDHETPPYAILSHRWIHNEEVSYEEYMSGGKRDSSGYRKILNTCQMVSKQSKLKSMHVRKADIAALDWVWIDTCCIDKRSSAELSEAINSMFNWYKRAKYCVAYLSDVDNLQEHWRTQFRNSQWFKRGWTLQELLAPSRIVFLDKDFWYMGESAHGIINSNVMETNLVGMILEITNIQKQFLHQPDTAIRAASAAQKMSWAVGRRTTRIEDMAYSLFGLFDINMPLLYGEGRKAFIRLQEEIFKQSGDESIFAWEFDGSMQSTDRSSSIVGNGYFITIPWNCGSMFASSPDDFKRSGSIRHHRAGWKTGPEKGPLHTIGHNGAIHFTIFKPCLVLPEQLYKDQLVPGLKPAYSPLEAALLQIKCMNDDFEVDDGYGNFVYVVLVYHTPSESWSRLPFQSLYISPHSHYQGEASGTETLTIVPMDFGTKYALESLLPQFHDNIDGWLRSRSAAVMQDMEEDSEHVKA